MRKRAPFRGYREQGDKSRHLRARQTRWAWPRTAFGYTGRLAIPFGEVVSMARFPSGLRRVKLRLKIWLWMQRGSIGAIFKRAQCYASQGRMRVVATFGSLLWVGLAVLWNQACDRTECSGDPLPCSFRLSNQCAVGDGCAFGTQCILVDCGREKTSADCQAHSYCHWFADTNMCFEQGSDPAECGGRAEADCLGQPSCTWKTACAGTVSTSCYEYKDQNSCSAVPGCNWGSVPGL